MGVHFSRAIQNPRAVGGDVYYVYDLCKNIWRYGGIYLLTRNVLSQNQSQDPLSDSPLTSRCAQELQGLMGLLAAWNGVTVISVAHLHRQSETACI